jgi:hypothetical protein
VRAKLKRLYSPDIPDLENWQPGEGPFGFHLQAMIGPSDTEGAESFDMTVCTPDWFAEQMQGQAVRSGNHILFVPAYDYRALKSFIERAVQRSEAENWNSLANRLSWLGHWEFADYQPRN